MTAALDHMILSVNDLAQSIAFYAAILGFPDEECAPPFARLRISGDFVLQLAPWGTKGGEHLAFAMPCDEFERVFERIRSANIPFGDRFDSVGNMRGPGEEDGARGCGKALYFFDPNQHLLEIRHYD